MSNNNLHISYLYAVTSYHQKIAKILTILWYESVLPIFLKSKSKM